MARKSRGRAALDASADVETPTKKPRAGGDVVVAEAVANAAEALLESPQENEYEKARRMQIERNKERLQALQLQALAASVLPPAPPRRAAPKKSQAKRAAKQVWLDGKSPHCAYSCYAQVQISPLSLFSFRGWLYFNMLLPVVLALCKRRRVLHLHSVSNLGQNVLCMVRLCAPVP